jgi:Fur family peroxide stress response transcriptional regulator
MKKSSVTINRAKNFLSKAGINPSYQRLRILEFLCNSYNHPTVDTIYNKLVRDIPTLSKTTIYNTLNLFQKRGLIIRLTIDEDEVRYDSNTDPHAHFHCTNCGCILDLEMESPVIEHEFVSKHRVLEKHLYLKGVCEGCINTDDSCVR